MVTITTNLENKMLIFDASLLEGAGGSFSKIITYPFHSINSLSLFDDRVVGQDNLGKSFDLTITPVANMYPISQVNGVVPTSIDHLYELILAAIF
jgi:hypothetical protein